MFDDWFKKQPPVPADGPDPVAAATQRLEHNPRDVLALMDRAGAYLARRNADLALRDLDRGLQLVLPETGLKPETRAKLLARLYAMQSQALAVRGQALGQQGNLVGAVVDLERALRLNPSNTEARFNGALAYFHAQNPTAAWVMLSVLLSQVPDDAEARSMRDFLSRELSGTTDPPLLPVAGTLERFAFSHCGPRRTQDEVVWRVGTLPVTTFTPDGSVRAGKAAALDLCQTPKAQIMIRVEPEQYVIAVQQAPTIPEIQRLQVPGDVWTTAVQDAIPAHPEALLARLNSYLEHGLLVQTGNRLRFQKPGG